LLSLAKHADLKHWEATLKQLFLVMVPKQSCATCRVRIGEPYLAQRDLCLKELFEGSLSTQY
jgi:hypothetical protein